MTDHVRYLKAAVEAAAACGKVTWYSVGCVLVDEAGNIVETGFTGELRDADGHQRHAEEIALSKAEEKGLDLEDLVLYSTLEPCSERASGKQPCVQQIIRSGIRRVVYGAREPYNPELGINCRGDQQLRDAGIEVVYFNDMEGECLRSAVRCE